MVASHAIVPSASGLSVGILNARARTRSIGLRFHRQSLPGTILVRSSLALFFSTLPSSGSLRIIIMKFFASFSVMCGGSGGTFGSV